MQTSGRVGRDPSQPAAYITVYEKKVSVRGSSPEILANLLKRFSKLLVPYLVTSNCSCSAQPNEREEAKAVRGMFSSEACLRTSLYRSFTIENPSGVMLRV